MIARVILAALLIDNVSATAQNMSQMGMAPYAQIPTPRLPGNPDPTAGARSGPYGAVRTYSNPMIQACPDGWGYGPTVSGTNPVCVAPDEEKK